MVEEKLIITSNRSALESRNDVLDLLAWPTTLLHSTLPDIGFVIGWRIPTNKEHVGLSCHTIIVLGIIPFQVTDDVSDQATNKNKTNDYNQISWDTIRNEMAVIQSKLQSSRVEEFGSSNDLDTNCNWKSISNQRDSEGRVLNIREMCFHYHRVEVVAIVINNNDINHSTNIDENISSATATIERLKKEIPDTRVILTNLFSSVDQSDNMRYPFWFDDEDTLDDKQILLYKSSDDIQTDVTACLYRHSHHLVLNDNFLALLNHAGIVWKEIKLKLLQGENKQQIQFGFRSNEAIDTPRRSSRRVDETFGVSVRLKKHSLLFNHLMSKISYLEEALTLISLLHTGVAVNPQENERLSRGTFSESHYEYTDRVTKNFNHKLRLILDVVVGVILGVLLAVWCLSDSVPSISVLVLQQYVTLCKWITWLENHPIGFKLNERLVVQFGQIIRFFCWIHAYTIRKLIELVTPVNHFVPTTAFIYCGVGTMAGGRCILAFLADLYQILIVPITIFDKIFNIVWKLELYVLTASWRLFRGKKRNVLRERTDTMDYDSMQLLVGTLMFATALFLLTTIFVYFVFFKVISFAAAFPSSIFILFQYRIIDSFPFGEFILRWQRRGWNSDGIVLHEVFYKNRGGFPTATMLRQLQDPLPVFNWHSGFSRSQHSAKNE